MPTPADPMVSFVLATHNRREVVLHTLERIAACGLDRGAYEIIAVDNASTDGTPEAIRGRVDRLLRLRRNAGSCAKAIGVEPARGRFIIFLDDDSFPRPGSVLRMMQRFERQPRLGAAGFTVHRPGGGREGGALPGVFVGCGVGLRVEALRDAGNLDRTFFMQAEEYDLAFRLAAAGWGVQVFDDLHVDHLKSPLARRNDRTTFLDVRNNLVVAARYLPRRWHSVYRRDWLNRYRWLAKRDGHMAAYCRGIVAGRLRGAADRWAYRPRRLQGIDLERFFRWAEVERRMADLRANGVEAVVFAGLGKNLYPFYRAAGAAGMAVAAVGDDQFAAPRRRYRGIPIRMLEAALTLPCDAVVVSDMAAHRAEALAGQVASLANVPVHNWFGRAASDDAAETAPPSPAPTAHAEVVLPAAGA